MGTLKFDLTRARNDVRDFPAGPIEAKILDAKVEVSKVGNPMITLDLEVIHPEYGTALLKDWLVDNFPGKVAKFWQAFNHLTPEEWEEMNKEKRNEKNGGVLDDNTAGESAKTEIETTDLIGASIIVVLGETTTTPEGAQRKNVAPPFYFADTELDELPYLSTPF